MNLPKQFDWVDVSDPVFADVLNRILYTNENLNLIGPAGVGKSLLIRMISTLLGGNVAITSTTGISAVNLNSDYVKAVTLHSFFTLAPLPYFPDSLIKANPVLYPKMKALDVLIIDEVSMLSSHMFDTIFKLLVLYKGSVSKLPRIILFSDILQLPPVVDLQTNAEVSEMYRTQYLNKIMFFNSHFFQDMEFKTIQLNKLQRQKDPTFQDILNRIRVQQQTKHDIDYLNQYVMPIEEYNEKFLLSMYLASTNKIVENVNSNYFLLFKGNPTIYKGQVFGTFDLDKINPMDREIKLKPNMQIMCTKNNMEEGYQNGSLGKVIECRPNSILAELANGDEVVVQKGETPQFEYYTDPDGKLQCKTVGKYVKLDCRASKSISIHKSQGQTLDAAYMDFGTWQFTTSLVYVGLSRLKNVNTLGLKRPLKMTDIKANLESLQFLDTI